MAFTLYDGRATWDKAGKVGPLYGAGPPINNSVYTVDAGTNRLTSVNGVAMSYDAAGNQTNDGSGQRTYDAENRMLTATNGGVSSSYTYDADGRRVKRIISGLETWQIYGIGGELLAEYAVGTDPSAPQKEYGYRDGQLLVVWDGSETGDRQLQWLVQDHLGSTRMVVDRSGSVGGVRRHDFCPFGKEMSAGVGIRSASNGYSADLVRQKFDAYERDVETGLDYLGARYMSSTQGRFTSPDPFMGSGRLWMPQSLNRYSYVINNPLRYTDEDGLDWYINANNEVQWFEKDKQPKGWWPFNPPKNQYNINNNQSVILNPNGPTPNGQSQEERQGWSYGPHVDDPPNAGGIVVLAGVTTAAQPEGPGEGASLILLLYALYLALNHHPVTPTALTPPTLTTTIPPLTLPAPKTDPNIYAKGGKQNIKNEWNEEAVREVGNDIEKQIQWLEEQYKNATDTKVKEKIKTAQKAIGGRKSSGGDGNND
jgi:RHS repeat-associated protein